MTDKPSKESQEVFYDKRWQRAASGPINKLQLKRLISILDMIDQAGRKGETRILDLGCGSGWLASIMSHIGSTTGIELSGEAASVARELYGRVDFRSGDLFEVLTEKDTFDIVVSQEVIEHVEDQPAFVNRVADSLKSGGHFIFTTPNAWAQAHRTEEEHAKWGLQPIENWVDRKQIKRLMAPRFEIKEIRSIIDGYGTIGIFRIVNSHRFRKLMSHAGLLRLYSSLILRLDFGLHLVVHAIRRI